jgi:hypothetical protein
MMKRALLLMGLASILGAAQRSVLVEAFSTISCPHLIIDEMTASCDTISGSVECLIGIETTLPVTEPDPRVFCVITERHVWGDGCYNRFIITVYNPAGAREVSPAGFPDGSTALRFLTSERGFTSRSQGPVSGRKALG